MKYPIIRYALGGIGILLVLFSVPAYGELHSYLEWSKVRIERTSALDDDSVYTVSGVMVNDSSYAYTDVMVSYDIVRDDGERMYRGSTLVIASPERLLPMSEREFTFEIEKPTMLRDMAGSVVFSLTDANVQQIAVPAPPERIHLKRATTAPVLRMGGIIVAVAAMVLMGYVRHRRSRR